VVIIVGQAIPVTVHIRDAAAKQPRIGFIRIGGTVIFGIGHTVFIRIGFFNCLNLIVHI